MQQKSFTRNDKVQAYIRLMRPPNSITAGVAVIAAMFLALNEGDEPYDLFTYLVIAAAAFFVTAHAMVHNDIVDYEVDTVNSPERPLPSQLLSLKEAKIWATILFIFAISSGLIIDYRLSFGFPIATFWAIQNSLLLDAYNKWFKKSGLFGNLVVAYVVWALFIFADIVVSNKPTLRVESIGLYAFFMNWGREVIKGIRDIDGDRESGIRTIAVRFGPKGGAIGGSVLLFIAVIWTIPLIIYPAGSITIPVILTLFDFVIIYRCLRLINNPTPANASSTKRLFLYMMLVAVIILLVDQIFLFV